MNQDLFSATNLHRPVPFSTDRSEGAIQLRELLLADVPAETLSLNFTKITETFTSMDPGRSGSPETVGYDLTKMKTV
jgi:hypothetical protein